MSVLGSVSVSGARVAVRVPPAARLEQGLREHAYERLVVAAPPHFLGLLKPLLGDEVKRRLEVLLNKDLTHHERPEIESHVRNELGF